MLLFMYTVPAMLAGKYGLGMFIVGTVCFVFVMITFAYCIRCCFPKCFVMKTPEMNKVAMNVIDMKMIDNKDFEAATNEGPGAVFSFVMGTLSSYVWSTLVGILCCQMFRPSVIFTFAKVLVVMLFTEIGMVVSAWAYIVPRFLCASVSWTLCSTTGWVREYFNTMAIKKRILQMRYPDFGWETFTGKAGHDDIEKPSIGEQCAECSLKCLPCCKCCTFCDACCDVCCDVGCDLTCDFCAVGCEMFTEVFSALLVVGKALVYTRRMLAPAEQLPTSAV
jgi:hypothetical protein